jgi:phage gpG-like protein
MGRLIEVETLDEWQAVFDGLAEQFAEIDYTDPLTEALPKLEKSHQEFFDNEAGPEGAWAPNAPSTVKRKGHGIVLLESGRLTASLVGRTADSVREVFNAEGQHSLIFGTDVPYSVFNQEGTSRAPARPHVGMTEETMQAVDNDVADWTALGLEDKS